MGGRPKLEAFGRELARLAFDFLRPFFLGFAIAACAAWWAVLVRLTGVRRAFEALRFFGFDDFFAFAFAFAILAKRAQLAFCFADGAFFFFFFGFDFFDTCDLSGWRRRRRR